MKKKICTLFFLCACFCQISAERRLALVIGNSEYGKNNYLENPVHDAEDVASKLRPLGFDVIKLTDGTLREMHEKISEFGEKAKQYDVALFYYSGHGLQTKGENYLMPIDAELKSEADVRYACVPLNLLLDKLDESNCPMKIVVLDACRNNPFVKRWYRGNSSIGLASVSPPKGTYITFSTAAGSVASDGTGRNSPYTTAFLETLDVPQLSLFDFFNEVGQKVLTETNNEQDPWTNHNTMKGKFFFNEKEKNADLQPMPIGTNIFPAWFQDGISDKWVGCSVPMTDMRIARKMAIATAVLHFLITKGGGGMEVVGNMSMNNTQISSEAATSYLGLNLHTTNEYKGFSVKIEKEYYNSRAEYFVLCNIRENSSTDNILTTKRTIELTRWNKLLSFHLSSVINGEPFQMDYTYKNIDSNDNYTLSLNGISHQTSSNLIYDDVLLQKTKTFSYYVSDMTMLGSLGYSRFSTLALAPVAPFEVTIRQKSKLANQQSLSTFMFSSQFMAKTTAQPLPISFVNIKNNQLGISIKDPYEFFLNDFSVDKSLLKGLEKDSEKTGVPLDFLILRSQEFDNRILSAPSCVEEGPLLFRKTVGIYIALPELSNDVNAYTNSLIDMEQGIEFISSDADDTNTLNNFHPFHLLDGQCSNSENTYVQRFTYVFMKCPIKQ